MRNFIVSIVHLSLNTARVIKSRILRRADNVARIEEYRITFRILAYRKHTLRKAKAQKRGQYYNRQLKIGINKRNWTDPNLDRDYCRALVNPILNLAFHKGWNYLVNVIHII